MNTFQHRLLAFAALIGGSICVSGPTLAASSEWAVTEGGRMRLIVTATDQPGQFQGALQIEPRPGWITYWREPGDSGIPPEVNFPPESGITVSSMDFPTPKRIYNGPVRDIGYDKAVTIPFTLSGPAGTAGVTASAQAFIGICQNICIPFQADLKVKLPSDPEPMDAILIAQSRHQLPESPSADFQVEHVARNADNGALTMTLILPTQQETAPDFFVTGPPGSVYMDFIVERREAERMTISMPIADLPEHGDPDGSTWRLLAISGERGMETPLAFK